MGFSGTLSGAVRRIGFSRVILGVVAILVVVAALLPPISLLRRLGVVGYETLSADNVAVSHPDGLTLQVDPEAYTGRVKVRLDSVPQLVFLEGSAGSELKDAVAALPEHLEVKSPFYRILKRGTPEGLIRVDVLVPNDAEPWETLDLYTWNGEAWSWVGSELHTEVAGHEFIRADVVDLPQSVVVVQNSTSGGVVATDLDADDQLSQVDVFDTVHPTGLLLGTMGGFAGDVEGLVTPDAGAGCAVVPTLRNWAPGKSVNEGLLGDLLDDAEAQAAHVENVVQMCTERGFDGIDIDYRGVRAEQREAFTSFVGALADALRDAEMRLSVTVERPVLVDGTWATGGYDLAALGQVVDVVHVPFPSDPEAYATGGRAHRLLDWVTAQVPRQKLHMAVSSLSVTLNEATGSYDYVSVEEALVPFGEASVLDNVAEVEPDTEVSLGLSGSLMSAVAQAEAGTYALRHRTEEGETSTTWLGTAANLAHKLAWAKRYELGGVVVADALNSGNTDGVLDVVAGYPDVGSVAVPGLEDMQIAWRVGNGSGASVEQAGPLANPSYTWTAPETAGIYRLSATVAGFDHGAVEVMVAEPEPVSAPITDTETITGTERAEETGDEDEEAGEEPEEVAEEEDASCLNARFLDDVTIPDNTQMEKGEAFDKTWQVENSGTCAWPEDTVLAFMGGEQMGAPERVEVPAVEPGGKKDVTVPMEAPGEDGVYTGNWQLQSGDTAFGGQLWVKIVVGEPQDEEQAAPPPSAPAPTGGGAFELGGHIRDGNFPYADTMHYAGMNWAKVQVKYPDGAAGVIAAAHANGFKIQISAIGTSPNMVTEAGFEQKMADWVATIAANGADAIEVWNEPNIDREWQAGSISPQAYTSLLCKAYGAIKNANPGTAVISAAPAPTGYFGGCSPNGCDDQPWLQGMYNAGAAQCMDYIGAHHNAGATSPSATSGHPANPGSTHHSWFFLPQTQLYYNIFGGTRKLFYTEMGYASQEGVPGFSDAFAWARGTNNAQQAAWLKEAVQLSINSGLVRCIIVWNIDFGRYGYDPQDGYAIIRPGGSCPACDALHSVLGSR